MRSECKLEGKLANSKKIARAWPNEKPGAPSWDEGAERELNIVFHIHVCALNIQESN